jgi:hypothetical protein
MVYLHLNTRNNSKAEGARAASSASSEAKSTEQTKLDRWLISGARTVDTVASSLMWLAQENVGRQDHSRCTASFPRTGEDRYCAIFFTLIARRNSVMVERSNMILPTVAHP